MKKGFTIIELIIIVVIIAIIVGFAVPKYEIAMRKAAEREMVLYLETLYGAEQMYFSKYNTYWDPDGSELPGGGTHLNTGTTLIDHINMHLETSFDRIDLNNRKIYITVMSNHIQINNQNFNPPIFIDVWKDRPMLDEDVWSVNSNPYCITGCHTVVNMF